jgi:hypothetical protein
MVFVIGMNLHIYMHVDEAKIGFLGRNEFFNAFRLVTITQSKREWFGPVVPAPQIHLAAIAPQP